jgi:hypothetical protein
MSIDLWNMSADIFKDLLVTEKDLLRDAVAKARDLIGIEEGTGRVVFRVPRESLGQRQLIALQLAGQYFAKQMDKVDSASLSISELSSRTGIDPNTLAGRLSELVKADWARRLDKARYEINQFSLNPILDEIAGFKRKSEFLQPIDERASERPTEPRDEGSFPVVPKSKRLTDSILHLLETEWGKTPREWREINEALKRNALHYSKGSITGTLTLLTQSGKIRRVKEGHSYKYVPR